MRKYLSLVSMYIYSRYKKVLVIIALMAAGCLIYAFLRSKGLWPEGSGLFGLFIQTFERQWIGIFFLFLSVTLTGAGDKKDGSEYTEKRLGIPGFGHFAAAFLSDLLYLGLFWIVRGFAALAELKIYEGAGILPKGPQGLFLFITSDVEMITGLSFINSDILKVMAILMLFVALVDAAVLFFRKSSRYDE